MRIYTHTNAFWAGAAYCWAIICGLFITFLWDVAVCCIVLQKNPVHQQKNPIYPQKSPIYIDSSSRLCAMSQCVAVCCSVLQCVAVCCSCLSVLQRAAERYFTKQCTFCVWQNNVDLTETYLKKQCTHTMSRCWIICRTCSLAKKTLLRICRTLVWIYKALLRMYRALLRIW